MTAGHGAVGLAVLAGSHATARAPSRCVVLTLPLRTPVVVGCALGLLLAATGLDLPRPVLQPVELVAALAVPAALLSYGMSLHGAPRPATGDAAPMVWLAVSLKTTCTRRWPTCWALAADLSGVALLAVTLTSALPTAQNVFVYPTAYDRATVLARDVVLLSTVLSVPSWWRSPCFSADACRGRGRPPSERMPGRVLSQTDEGVVMAGG